MDLGESIFRFWLRWKKRGLDDSENDSKSHTIALKEISDRLRYLSLLISGSLHEIKGGIQKEEVREFLIFPDQTNLLEERSENTELLLFRLVFYLTGIELGIFVARTITYKEQFLFNCISSNVVLDIMLRRYPGIRSIADKLYRAVLSTRPVIGSIEDDFGALETLAQLRLSRSELLPEPLSFLKPYWQEPLKNRLTERALDVLLKRLQTKRISNREPPPPVWLWGFTAPAVRNSMISELPKILKREGKEVVINLERTVHLKKWSQSKKESNPLFHSFEKTESVEDYGGENTADAIEDLSEDDEAMKDLTLGSVIRTTESTRGLLKADVVDEGIDFTVEGGGENAPGVAFCYPEWDYRQKKYRSDWCTLYEIDQEGQSGAAYGLSSIERAVTTRRAREVKDIRSSLLRLLSSREARNRQLDGPEIDYDAVLERYADVTAGHSPSDRLYLAQRKVIKDIAFLVLLDTSLSTDGYVDGRRILDVEIESCLILAAAFEGYLDKEVAVAHFNSRTRNDCRFTYLKRFEQSWTNLRRVCGSLDPDGYTRIGPAIRHATKALSFTKARKKFLLIVSDGKPSDYDQYEGRYGINDVAQAIREARQQRIMTFGLAVEHQTKARLAEMFGAGRYHVLPKSALLPGYMADIFLRAMA